MNQKPAPIPGLTQEESEGLRVICALLGDGRTKYGKRIRAYLDGTDNLEEVPKIRDMLDEAINKLRKRD